jgi:hypothetical protein
MFGHETFVTVFFRFANFIVLVGLGVYVFKKYALPSIFIFMREQREEHERLEHQRVDLEAAHAVVAQELQDDSLICATLKTRIDEWRKKSDMAVAMREKERQKRMIVLYKAAEYREKIREQQRVEAVVAEKVAIELREELSRYFDKKEVSSAYINAVIHSLEKDVS